MIRFGVVGLGFMDRCHLATLAGLGGALSAGIDPAVAAALAEVRSIRTGRAVRMEPP